MSNFFTRPRFQDRDIVQLSGDTISLSGETNIDNIFRFKPNAVAGYVLTALDNSGTVYWALNSSGGSQTFTGNTSGDCITDLWVTNIHGCSPITVWDNLQTVGSNANGLGSTALGIANTSDGVGSSAFGGGTTAFGSASFSEGYQTLALGDSSHAEGYQTIAGYKALTATSVVAGVVTISDNVDYSSEFTSGTALLNNQFYTYTGTSYSAPNFFINLSNFSVTIPLFPVIVVDSNNYNSPLAYISEGDHSHAEGILTRALGPASHAEGQFTNSMGNVSHAEGELTLAYGAYSHAEGQQTLAYGPKSHAQGVGTSAIGDGSHSEGGGTNAYGYFSHAQGVGTSAIGYGSHAEGYGTNAYGLYSHAGGSGSTVSGITSFIHSTDSLLTGNRSVLLGGLNLTGTTDDTVYVPYLNIGNVPTGISVSILGITSGGTVIEASDFYDEICDFCNSNVSSDMLVGSGATETSWLNTDGSSVDSTSPYSCTQWCYYRNGDYVGTTTDYKTALKYQESGYTLRCCDSNSSDGGTNYGISVSGLTTTTGGTIPLVITGLTRPYIVKNAKKIYFNNVYNSDILSSNQVSLVDSTLSLIELSTLSSIRNSFNSTIYSSYLSRILSSENGFITGSGNANIIGSQYSILSGVTGSTIIGGNNIIGLTNDTVYIPYLNISSLGNGSPINNLGIDSNGFVVTGTTSGSGGISINPYYTEPSNTTITWDVSGNSTNYQTTLTANTTLNLTNVRNGDYGTLIATQDAVGSKTITFGTVNGGSITHRVVNGGGGSPTLTSNANAIDILTFTYNGSSMYWTVGNDYT